MPSDDEIRVAIGNDLQQNTPPRESDVIADVAVALRPHVETGSRAVDLVRGHVAQAVRHQLTATAEKHSMKARS